MQTIIRNGREVRLIPTPFGHKLQEVEVDYKSLYEQAVAQGARFSQEHAEACAQVRYWYQRAMENETYREAWEQDHKLDRFEFITNTK
ncbi:hypothetical protein [Lactococcus kimchii]|uniref:hypothetical protein n=1 Tax=Lactococcus sp. S-13 TaxID=2507158 RepID=UPI001023D357|nr:hypothetical protein [Lactococcus sp. S-13]RZI47989.1 hypothetical protein EQJ87_00160 [Lactococcus sp. S-13]RZI49821.1 hypothetical protein EQJ87_10510 [Lactococcus sp. S-13]